MTEKTKKQKKGSISEEDVSTLLQRYSATTILALLQEVAQQPGVKLNWNALVKKTSTGISNAREYQMLWRHLAYRDSLLEKFDDGAEPLDDDSDLEYELEPCPSVSGETSAEAAACVKVLISSGLPTDSSPASSSMVVAPLTINIPNSKSSRRSLENSQPTCSMRGMNITIPLSVQKQILPAVASTVTLEGNGSAGANLPSRRKRKPWSEAEDMELISAVQKCGVGNWANILQGDFKGDRTTSQLAQRWTIIKKRLGNSNVEGNSTVPQLSEALLATRSALSLALDMPDKNLTAACTNNPGLKITSSTSAPPTTGGEASVQVQSQFQRPIASAQSQSHSQQGSITSVSAHNQSQKAPIISIPSPNQPQKGPISSVPSKSPPQQVPVASVQVPNPSQQGPMTTKTSPQGSSIPSLKSRVSLKKPPTYFYSTGSILDATAVAAGARIGSPEAAASVLKAAQSKNAIHLITSGGSSVKPLIPGGPSSHLEVHSSCTSRPGSVKSATQRVEHTPASSSSSLNFSIQQCNAIMSSPTVEGPLKEEPEAAVDIKGSVLDSLPAAHMQENGGCALKNELGEGVKEQKAAASDPESEFNNLKAVAEHPNEKLVVECHQVNVRSNLVEGCQNVIDSTVDNSLIKKSDC